MLLDRKMPLPIDKDILGKTKSRAFVYRNSQLQYNKGSA